MQVDWYANDFAVLELSTNTFILNIFLEATYIIRLYIFLRVRSIPRYGNRVKHSHQVGKGLCIAVVRCGRSKDKGVTLLGKELSEVATQTVLVGHLMTLIYHYDVPMGLLKPCTEATIVLQRIDADDGLVVIVKGILVERYLTLNLGNTDTVKTNKRYGKAVPDFFLELGKNALNVHLTYVPYLKAAGELKTKPTQHSVKELQSVGIQPDILILRTEKHLEEGILKKVASFCNVDIDCVIQSEDLPSIYEVPVNMQNQGLDTAILRKMDEPIGEKPALGPWKAFLDRRNNATEVVNIGLVGKYDLQDAYKSIRESLSHAGTYNDHKVNITFINSEYLTEDNVAERLKGQDGIVICPGFGQRGREGKIIAAHYTRTHDIPTFGICLGMQMIVIEFARNVLGYKDANSREMDEKTPHNVIDIMEEQKNISNMGGTMRLGAYECVLKQGSRVFNIYKKEHIQERHRHRYEFNNNFQQEFEKHGMMCVGRNPESDLVEIVEIPGLKWYIGTQYHPEYQSTVLKPHPLFIDFVKTAIENKK